MKITQKQIDNFWRKVDIKGEDECWEWMASKDKDGYGAFGINYKIYKSHRISWILTYGEIPEGMFVCHKCDSPGCSRPDHLFLGTQKDNMIDKKNKNRCYSGNHTGIKNGNVKLTEQQVIEIKNKYIPKTYTHKMLGEEYGVTRENIGHIINRKSWRSI